MPENRKPDALHQLLTEVASRPTVPLPGGSGTKALPLEGGWSLLPINDLWADQLNAEGDFVLVSPRGRVLHATWDVASPPGVEQWDDPNLQLGFHLPAPIASWEALLSAVSALVGQLRVEESQ